MMKHISWLKYVSEQEAEMMAEYSQPKWCLTLELQKDSSKRERVIVKEHTPPHVHVPATLGLQSLGDTAAV